MRPRRVIGVLGGTFDPPHLGHALLPPYLLARGWVDTVLVVPCADHPLGKSTSPFSRRLAWTRAAMEQHGPRVHVSDVEARLAATEGGPSYSLRMLRALQAEHPDARLRMVVGSDITARGEHLRWHRWDELEHEFCPLVVPRAGYEDDRVRCALPDVSSTQVRAWLAAGDWDALAEAVPEAVLRELKRSPSSPRPSVWIVGRGHVQSHLEPWLAARGVEIAALGARALLDGTLELPSSPPALIWVAVRDANIRSVCEWLSRHVEVTHQIPMVHSAGRFRAADVLQAWQDRGQPVGTLHPICSLRRGVGTLEGASFGIEGDAAVHAWADAWIEPGARWSLEGLGDRERRAYHAACALVANHIAVLLDPAVRTLDLRPQSSRAAWRAVTHLMGSAVANVARLGIPEGVSGPVSRGEMDVAQAHAEALDPDAGLLYRQLSERLAQILARGVRTPEGEP